MPGWPSVRSSRPTTATRDGSAVELSFRGRFGGRRGKPPPPPYPPPSHSADDVSASAEEIDVEDRPPPKGRARRASSSYTDDGGPDSADVGAHVTEYSTMVITRAVLSAIAVGLLWMSSLDFISDRLHDSTLLPIPPVPDVLDATLALYNESVRLRETYIECVQDELSVCNATLIRRRDREAERSEEARKENAETRDRSRATQGSCATLHATAFASVAAWQRQQGAASLFRSWLLEKQYWIQQCSNTG